MGDPAGIGPENCSKSISNSSIYQQCKPLLIGNAEIIKKAVEIAKVDLK